MRPLAWVRRWSRARLSTAAAETRAKPDRALAAAHRVTVKAGVRRSWCACGHSARLPFCDGTHKAPDIGAKPVRMQFEADTELVLCGCVRTADPAGLCDCELRHKV